MRTFCKNCLMKCWEDDPTGMFDINGFGENCALYIDNFSGKSIRQLIEEEQKNERT